MRELSPKNVQYTGVNLRRAIPNFPKLHRKLGPNGRIQGKFVRKAVEVETKFGHAAAQASWGAERGRDTLLETPGMEKGEWGGGRGEGRG